MAKNDFIKPLDHRKSEIQRLIVSVNEFYKHDGDDVTYVHGIEVRTKTPVRIRLSSLEELSENNNKLKSTYFGNKTPEEQMDLVRGRRARQRAGCRCAGRLLAAVATAGQQRHR